MSLRHIIVAGCRVRKILVQQTLLLIEGGRKCKRVQHLRDLSYGILRIHFKVDGQQELLPLRHATSN
jgi:hypothetical protein